MSQDGRPAPHGGTDAGERGGPAGAGVRRAEPVDAPVIGALQASVWRDELAGVLSPDVVAGFQAEAFAHIWLRSLAAPPSPQHVLWVAVQGGRLVGMAALGPCPDPDRTAGAEILTIGVAREHRRGGHGGRLVNACADSAAAFGFASLTAWAPGGAVELIQFLKASGMALDGGRRSRVAGPDDRAVEELRLTAALPGP